MVVCSVYVAGKVACNEPYKISVFLNVAGVASTSYTFIIIIIIVVYICAEK